MRVFTLIFSASCAALLLFANPVLSGSTANSPIEAELINFNERFNAATASYDAEAFLSLYSDEALWIAPGKPPIRGHDTPRKTFQFLVGNEGVLTHTIDNVFISKDGLQAVMIGQTDIKTRGSGLDATGTYLFVLKRVNDDWKIVADMFNQHAPQ